MNHTEWLKNKGLNQSDLGRIIDRDRARAHRITKGAEFSYDEMRTLFHISNGAVTPNDIVGIKIEKPNKADS